LEAEILKKLHERIVKSFMDILILAELRKGRPMSGYELRHSLFPLIRPREEQIDRRHVEQKEKGV